MSDFHQNGNITTLHNLRTQTLENLEYELSTFAQTRRITLILPSLYSELEGEALPHILNELAQVPYLHRIIIGLDQADAAQYNHAALFSGHAQRRQGHRDAGRVAGRRPYRRGL